MKERQAGQQQHPEFNSANRTDHDNAGVGGAGGLGGELVEKRGVGTRRPRPPRRGGVDRPQVFG